MKRVSAVLLGLILALSVHASGILSVLLAGAATKAPSTGIKYIQPLAIWSGTTTAASASFTPAGAGDSILVYGADYTSSGAISFSGSGTYSVNNPPGQFQDVESDSTALAANAVSNSGAQTVTVTTSGSGDLVVGIGADYSGVGSIVSAAKNSQTHPGAGAGAVLGTSVSVPTGDVLVSIAIDLDGSSLSATSGTTRLIASNYVITDYAGAGSAIQPAFTSATGAADHYLVVQWLLAPPSGSVAMKWTPGYYGLSDGQSLCAGCGSSGYLSEITYAIDGNTATVKGYTFYVYWSGLESSTLGNWQFLGCTPPAYTSCSTTYPLDQILNHLRSNGEKAIIVLNLGTYGESSPTLPASGENVIAPGYITNSSGGCATYGAGNVGSSGLTPTGACGYYAQADDDGTWAVNFVGNTNVYNRLVTMLTQLGSVYDQDPVLEGIIFEATDATAPDAGTGLEGSPYTAALESLVTATQTAFPHTTIGMQVQFDEAGGFSAGALADWLVKHKGAMSISDTFGASAWTAYNQGGASCTVGGSPSFTGTPGSTGATLTSNWACNTTPATLASGTLFAPITLGSGQIIASPTFTNGSTAVTWPSVTITGSPGQNFTFNMAPVFGARHFQQGMQAWMGISTNGAYTPSSPALQTYSSSWPLIETDDICSSASGSFSPVYSAADIIAALNLTGQNGYEASHPSFNILQSGQCSAPAAALWAGAGGVLSALQATPLTNTGYPPIY